MGVFDLDGGVYDSKSLDVSGEDAAPYSVRLSSDGTKAYIGGISNKKVFQYTLTTAFDISSGSYASKSLDVAGEMTGMHGMTFNSAGTKVYVMAAAGALAGFVVQYNLGTAWDVSTGSYALKSMDPTSETGGGVGTINISSDGTKAYVADSTGETVYQYTLSTADDISSGSYASKSMSFGTQTSAMRGMDFASNGEHVYIADPGTDTFYQYNLTTAWDVSTGSYASKSLDVSSQDGNMFGVHVSSDGFTAYGVGTTATQKIYQYKLVDPPVQKTASDSATLTVIKQLVVQLSKVDAATLTEVKQLVAKLAGVDAASLSETSILDIITPIVGVDSATLTEQAILSMILQITGSDSATLSESATLDVTFLTVSLDLRGSTYLYRTFPPQEAPKLVRFGRKFLSRIAINAGVQVYAERVSGVWEVTAHPGTRSPVAGVDWASTDGAVDNDVRVYNGGSLLEIGSAELQEVSDIADAFTAAGYTVVIA